MRNFINAINWAVFWSRVFWTLKWLIITVIFMVGWGLASMLILAIRNKL